MLQMFPRYFGINVFKRHNSESKVTIVCVRHNFLETTRVRILLKYPVSMERLVIMFLLEKLLHKFFYP